MSKSANNDMFLSYEYKTKNNIFDVLKREKISEVEYNDTIECIYKFTLPYRLGHSFGNDLRSFVYKNSSGVAVCALSIEVNGNNAQHQFDILSGLVEPIQNIVLNIRNLCIKFTNKDLKIAHLTINKSQSGAIKASDITSFDEGIEIINKDLVICNLDIDANLVIKIIACNGFGYVLDKEHEFSPELQRPYFPVTSSFSSVVSCVYHIESIDYKSILYDEVMFTLCTKGNVHPDDAIQEILNYRSDISSFFCIKSEKTDINDDNKNKSDDINSSIIENMPGLGSRAKTSLAKRGIVTIGQLRQKCSNELFGGGMGQVTVKEIITWLGNLGISLADNNMVGEE